MNQSLQDYIDSLIRELNISGDISDMYYIIDDESVPRHELNDWKETMRMLSILCLVISITFCVFDLLLLVPAIFASARKWSASWYMYHLNFVTVLNIVFSLLTLRLDMNTFSVCMLLTFIHWTLIFVYSANLALMNIEIMATILAANPKWKPNAKTRFVVSMTITWIVCILVSVLIMFFGHEEHEYILVCFNRNDLAVHVGHIARDWFPALFIFVEMLVGIVLFIRAKRSPQNYSHMTESESSFRTYNEWFAFFMAWNIIYLVIDGLMYEMFMIVVYVGFFNKGIIGIAVFIMRGGVPLVCLILGQVREAYKEVVMRGIRWLNGEKRTQTSDADTQELHIVV